MAYSLLYILSLYLVIQSGKSHTDDCPDIYLRYSKHHSYCKPKNASCDIVQTLLTQEEIEQVLELHNSFRSNIATQSEANATLPPAANMLQMEWDYELASVAQRYAEQCIYAHDGHNQRRVQNFGVGQNIAIQKLRGKNIQPPNPDWSFAVTTWFEEIAFFSSELVCPFQAPPKDGQEYRHFTQLIWSNTFRVGCGYTLYKKGNTFIRLYICNYGPAGNVYETCVYNEDAPCSQCPQNTCCGESCILDDLTYPGLCKRYNGEAPVVLLQQPTIFDCNFQDGNKEDCLFEVVDDHNWTIIPALGGNYLETVLSSGQNSTIIFSKSLQPSSSSFCVQIKYRKGPTKDGHHADNKATESLVIPSINGYTVTQTLTNYSGSHQQQFNTFNLTLNWDEETQIKISFAVGAKAHPQYFNIDSIVAVDKECEN